MLRVDPVESRSNSLAKPFAHHFRLATRSAVFGVLAIAGIAGHGQKQPVAPPPPVKATTPTYTTGTTSNNTSGYDRQGLYPYNDGTGDPMEDARHRRLLAAFAADRHKKMVSDTKKLISLTGDLKSTFSEQATKSASDAELRKVKEIEKLAKQVRENMVIE
jgi:hypothetical protein